MITRLGIEDIEEMLSLQNECISNRDLFLPTSRSAYLRAFAFHNFCLGYREEEGRRLVAFLNCSIPTGKSRVNLGRRRLPEEELDAVGHMNTLLVLKSHRHSGIGHELVLAALDHFRRQGCRHIYVTVDEKNAPSIKLLHSMQFHYQDTIVLQGHDRYLFCRHFAESSGS